MALLEKTIELLIDGVRTKDKGKTVIRYKVLGITVYKKTRYGGYDSNF